jgi:hypothetical protein
MSDIALEKILAQVTKKKKDEANDRILAEAAATSPELYARIVAARGEAARIGVAVGADNRVDLIALDAALKASGRDPLARMAIKKTMALAGMID